MNALDALSAQPLSCVFEDRDGQIALLTEAAMTRNPATDRRGKLGFAPAVPDLNPKLSYDMLRKSYAAEIERRLQDRFTATGLVRRIEEYHINVGGKRLRALLPVWVCVNLGHTPDMAVELGVGLELLHNATLVHDDLQDGDTLRRGQPTVWRRWGEAMAINAGDALIFEAFACITRVSAGADLVGPAAAACLRLCEGQAMELQLQLPHKSPEALPATLEVWGEMARAKTGALFGLCLRAGSVAAGRSDAFSEAAARYGEELGLLFQVQDDLLDLVGDKGRGRLGSDLMEGKCSFPVALAYASSTRDGMVPVRALLERPREERSWAMVDEALEALARCGALRATASWLQRSASAAIRHPLAVLLPGFVEQILAPVRHALGAMDEDAVAL